MGELTREQIKARILLGDLLIGMLAKDPDPKAPEVARILGEQRAELAARLETMGPAVGEQTDLSGPQTDPTGQGGQPPAVVVGLKTLVVEAKRG